MENIKQNTKLSMLSDIFCYKAKNFYILTIPKVASSWVYQLFLNNEGLRDIPKNEIHKNDNNTIGINQLNFNTDIYKSDETSYDTIKFEEDWNLFLQNKSEVDFIFLMRDPISKFITGLMQDVILHNFKMDSPHIIEILKRYPYIDAFNEFNQFNKSKIADGNEEWWNILDLKWNDSIYNVMYFIVKNIVDKWMGDVDNIVHYRNGHKNVNLFLYYKLIFNSKINKNKIKILDIDTENIYDYLVDKYNLDLVHTESKFKFNETASIFKKIIKKSMLKHEELISSMFYLDLLVYCDIHNYLYSEQITPETVWFDSLLKYKYE